MTSNYKAQIASSLEEVRKLMNNRDYKNALSKLDYLAAKLDSMPEPSDKMFGQFFNFGEPFEEVLYSFINNPEKPAGKTDIPYSEVYYRYGNLLLNSEKMEEAKKYLGKAVRWQPTSVSIGADYIETFKITGEMEEFFRLTKEAFRYAYKPKELARCYRNCGYYFSEKELYPEANACYLLSLQYDPEAESAVTELQYIEQESKEKLPQPTAEFMQEMSEKYGFPIGPHQDVMGLAYSYGRHFYERKMNPQAKYFLKIAYDFSKEADLKALINSL